MEITSFVLGILSVVFILGIVVGVFGARKITKLEKDNNQALMEINELHRRISGVSEMDNRRIDGEIDRTNRLINNTEISIHSTEMNIHRRIDEFDRDVNDRFDNLYRDLDSRFDKLENRLKAETKSKQLLKD